MVKGLVKFLDLNYTFLNGLPAKIGTVAASFGILSKVIAYIKNQKIGEFFKNVAENGLRAYVKSVKEATAATEELAEAEATEQGSKAAVSTGGKAGAIGAGIVAGVLASDLILSTIEWFRHRQYSLANESMDESNKTIEKTEEELTTLRDLQNKLTEAKGDRVALASIYGELNEKIGVSSSLLNGESESYAIANAKIEDQIKLKEKLIEKEKELRVEYAKSALDGNLVKSSLFGIDWMSRDIGYEKAVEYRKEYLAYSEEDQEKFLKLHGITKNDWEAYWDEQADYAITAYQEMIDGYSGVIDLTGFFKEAVKSGAVNALSESEVSAFIQAFSDEGLTSAVEEFYTALEDSSEGSGSRVADAYEKLYIIISNLQRKYPELTDALRNFMDVAMERSKKGLASIYQSFYEDISLSKFFDTYQEPFDLLTSALEELQEYGDLSADTIKKLLDSGIDLPDEFGETAESCTLAADALDRYVEKLLNEAIAAVAAANSTDELNIARENANRLITTLTILNKTYERSNRKKAIDAEKDALKAQKKALEDEKDVLEDQKDALDEQLDAYKELIDYRKELIESYQKEVEYQRELERKQQNLAKLQARLSAAQLDTSAAGRGRARDIQEQVAEAQQELDDYTLEHAVDILVDQLDDQYSEYENFINEELAAIDNQTQALDNRGKSIEDTISNLDTTPEVYVDTASISEMLAQASADLDRTYAETNAHLAQIEANTTPPNSHTFSPGVKAYSTSSPYSLPGSTPLIDTKYSITTVPSEGNKIMTRSEFNKNTPMQRMYGTYENYVKAMHKLGIYHSGGTVGGDSYLKSNEEFAKLMKGEYVSTPKQMETFLSKTLPTMANSIKSGNEFNAPLVSVSCENVTQDSLPGLREIIDEAVEKVQKKLVDGFNRTGFKSPINKKLAT